MFAGKSFENVRKRANISLVTNGRKAEKMTAQPTFKRVSIINEGLCLIERIKGVVTLDKPIYTGYLLIFNNFYIFSLIYYATRKTAYLFYLIFFTCVKFVLFLQYSLCRVLCSRVVETYDVQLSLQQIHAALSRIKSPVYRHRLVIQHSRSYEIFV